MGKLYYVHFTDAENLHTTASFINQLCQNPDAFAWEAKAACQMRLPIND